MNQIKYLKCDEYGIEMIVGVIIGDSLGFMKLNDFYSHFINSIFCENFRFDVLYEDKEHTFVADLIFGGTLKYNVVLTA